MCGGGRGAGKKASKKRVGEIAVSISGGYLHSDLCQSQLFLLPHHSGVCNVR